MCVYTSCEYACNQESEDDHNEGMEMITTSEAAVGNKCQKKHARGVSEQAHDINKIHTWHRTVDESMADLAQG